MQTSSWGLRCYLRATESHHKLLSLRVIESDLNFTKSIGQRLHSGGELGQGVIPKDEN